MSAPPLIERTQDIAVVEKSDIRRACLQLAARLAERAEVDPGAPGAGLLRGPSLNPEPGFPEVGTPMLEDQCPVKISRTSLRQKNDDRETIHLYAEILDQITPSYQSPDPPQPVTIENAAEEFNKSFDGACESSFTQLRLETEPLKTPSLPREAPDDSGKAHHNMPEVSGLVTMNTSFIIPHDLPKKHGAINWQLIGGPAIYVVINPTSTKKFTKELNELKKTKKLTGAKEASPNIIPSLSFLEAKGIGFHLMVQEKGDIIVYLPGTYYYGFNTTARYGEFMYYRLSTVARGEIQDDIILNDSLTPGQSSYNAQVIDSDGAPLPAIEQFGHHVHASTEDSDLVLDHSDSTVESLPLPPETTPNHEGFVGYGSAENVPADHLSWAEVMEAMESADEDRRYWAQRIHTAWPHIKRLPPGLAVLRTHN